MQGHGRVIAALRRAFAKTRAVTGNRTTIRYSDDLKRMATAAIRAGVDRAAVLAATGVSEPSVEAWLVRFKSKTCGKSPRPPKAQTRRFKRLEIVGGTPPAPQAVTVRVGRVVLEVPVELVSADLIRRIEGGDA
jgi:hypothetical protein